MELFLILLLGFGVLLLLTPFLIYRPWESIIFFGVFLLFQDYLIAIIPNSTIQSVLKSVDEGFVWFFFLISILVSKNRKIILLDYLVIGMLLTGLVSSYLNAVKPVIIVSDIILMFKFYALFRAVTLRDFAQVQLSGFSRLVFVIGLLFFIIGFIEVLLPTQIKSLIWGRGLARITVDERSGIVSANGFFVHPGVYGWFMAVAAAFAIARYFVSHQKKYIYLFAVFILGILFSMRRKPLVGITLAILIFFYLNYGKIKSIRISAILSVVAGILLIGIIFQDQIVDLAESAMTTYFSEESVDTAARDVLYYVSGKIAIDRFPFGVGLGRFAGFISMKYYSDVYSEYEIDKVWGLTGNDSDASFGTDTFYPYLLGELGIIGFLFFCYFLYKLFQNCLRNFQFEADVEMKCFTAAACVILLESFFEAFASPIYANSMSMFFVLVPAAMAYNRLIPVKGNSPSLVTRNVSL
jgi:O-antigen ligase